jgi:RNA polymerase sigma-70 factor (ECF subfamily)
MIDNFRRVQRLQPIDGLEDELVADGFEDASSARIDVDDLLGTLPDKQARMIRATRIEGLSIAEAAAAAGLGESDVKISVHRGIKALMTRIHGDGR